MTIPSYIEQNVYFRWHYTSDMKKHLIFLSLLFLVCISYGQIDYNTYPKVTSTFLINDVIIQKSPLDSFGLGDILIEKGRITRISKEITAPVNAQIIEGDTAYVYPAFIDGLSHTGTKKVEKAETPEVKFRGYPPNSVVGITPEVKATDIIDVKHESIKKMRENGFAISHVVPQGKMLPGQGSIILLNDGPLSERILVDESSLFLKLEGSRGYYPATVIGVMAKWRELYHQASFLDKHLALSKSATIATRVKKDASLSALIPYTKGQKSVFMKATKAKDIHRSIALKKDLGHKLVLTDIKQGWETIEKLKKNNVEILLSYKLPKEEKTDKKEDKKPKDKATDKTETGEKEPVKKTDEKQDDKKAKPKMTEEQKALTARKEKAMAEYVSQAARFEEAKIKFGFSSLDGKVEELKPALIRMIAAGLSQSTALAALTTDPARILGIDKITGTLAEGKLANIIMTDVPYFTKDSQVKMVLVEGQPFEIEVKDKKSGGGDVSDDLKKQIAGTWSYTVETPGEEYTGKIVVATASELEITIYSSDAPDDGTDCTIISSEDNELVFTFPQPGMGEIEINIKFDGEEFEGRSSVGEFGSFPITGTRLSSPENHKH